MTLENFEIYFSSNFRYFNWCVSRLPMEIISPEYGLYFINSSYYLFYISKISEGLSLIFQSINSELIFPKQVPRNQASLCNSFHLLVQALWKSGVSFAREGYDSKDFISPAADTGRTCRDTCLRCHRTGWHVSRSDTLSHHAPEALC